MSTRTARNGALASLVRQTALDAFELGLSVLPPVENGTKAPLADCVDKDGGLTWDPAKKVPADRSRVEGWYDPAVGRHGIGLVGGAVSGGLELFEFDDWATYEHFKQATIEAGLGDLIERIEAGYLEHTPGEGVHWFYFCDEVRGSTKLARRPAPTEKNPHGVQTLIETKGEGGFVIIAPSGGPVHPSGRPYELLRGGLGSIVTLTSGERESLWELARTFDEMPAPDAVDREADRDREDRRRLRAESAQGGYAVLPGEDFNRRAAWEDILDGWTFLSSRGAVRFLRRPGKDRGISASIRNDRLNVYTSSSPFEPVLSGRKTYDKFGAFALLQHRGDLKAASKALGEKGYGVREEKAGKARAGGKTGSESRPPETPVDYATLTDEELGIIPGESIRERPIDWLWKYRLQVGELALMAGDAGMGKSLILLKTAALISVGGERPDGTGRFAAGNVVILSAEDNPETSVIPRFRLMGGDVTRLKILKAKVVIKQPGKSTLVDYKSLQDRSYWTAVFRRIGGVSLFLVDPLPSYLGRGVNDSKNLEIRAVLEPFIDEILRPCRICMWGNTHLNKSIDMKTPLHRITGSMAYGALPRNVHFCVPDPDDPKLRYFKQAKCNDAPGDLPAIAFRVQQGEYQNAAGERIESAYPVFEEKPVEVNLGDVMGDGGKKPGRKPVESSKFAEWLWEYLQAGPVMMMSIIDAARDKKFLDPKTATTPKPSLTPLYNAKLRLAELHPGFEVEQFDADVRTGIVNGQEIFKPYKHWRLNPQPERGPEEEDLGPAF